MILRELETGDGDAFDRAIAELAEADPTWTFAFGYAIGDDFARYVATLRDRRDGIALPDGHVPSTFLVAVEVDRIVGRGSIRHHLDAALLETGGHIGFGVVPSARRRGVATEILRGCVARARGLGIARALVTCDVTNLGSRATIQRAGGVLEDVRGQTCRFWI